MKASLSRDGLKLYFYPDIPYVIDEAAVVFSSRIVEWLDDNIGPDMWQRETGDVILASGTALGRIDGERFVITFKRHEDALMALLAVSA